MKRRKSSVIWLSVGLSVQVVCMPPDFNLWQVCPAYKAVVVVRKTN